MINLWWYGVMLSNDLCSENPCDEAQSDDFEIIHWNG